jgi:hypothetical protein
VVFDAGDLVGGGKAAGAAAVGGRGARRGETSSFAIGRAARWREGARLGLGRTTHARGSSSPGRPHGAGGRRRVHAQAHRPAADHRGIGERTLALCGSSTERNMLIFQGCTGCTA